MVARSAVRSSIDDDQATAVINANPGEVGSQDSGGDALVVTCPKPTLFRNKLVLNRPGF